MGIATGYGLDGPQIETRRGAKFTELVQMDSATHPISRTMGKGKGNARTGHEGPKGEQRYNSTLSLTSALDGVGGQRHAPAALPPAKDSVPIV